jgi:uncharacterized membrane protein
MVKRFIKYFLQGLLFTVPLFITLTVIYKVITGVGSLIQDLGLHIHPILDPFLGFIIVILFIVFVGMIGTSIFFDPVFKWFEKTIEKAPLIKVIYSSIKDLMSAVVGQKKRFNRPVLVTVSQNPLVEKLGFVTHEDLMEIGIEKEKVAVYFPYSYAFSGQLVIVSKYNIKPIDAPPAEVMKFIVSGGVTDID